MFKNKLNYKLINTLLLIVIFYLLYLIVGKWGTILGKIISVSIPFLIAFSFAYVLDPFVKKLEEKGVRKKLAVALVSLVVVIVFVGLIWVSLPIVYEQLISLSKTLIQVLSDVSNKFDINLGEFSITITETLNSIIKNIGTYLSTGTIDIVNKGFNLLTNVMIIFIVGIYFLNDMDNIREKIKTFLRGRGKREYLYVKKLDHEIGNYFHGLAIFMVVQLIEYSLLFKIVGHPEWVLLGVLACITTIIPYFGGWITNIIAVITASVVSTRVFIATLIICLIFPNLDGYLISPRIYGKTNNINPVTVIFVVGLCGSLFGFMGIVLALPLYILLKASYEYYEDDIKRKIEEKKESAIE